MMFVYWVPRFYPLDHRLGFILFWNEMESSTSNASLPRCFCHWIFPNIENSVPLNAPLRQVSNSNDFIIPPLLSEHFLDSFHAGKNHLGIMGAQLRAPLIPKCCYVWGVSWNPQLSCYDAEKRHSLGRCTPDCSVVFESTIPYISAQRIYSYSWFLIFPINHLHTE